jgi:acetyl esterase/lipase
MLLKIPVIVLCLFTCMVQAQSPKRYKDFVFKDVTFDKDGSYNPQAEQKEKKSYLFDLYRPAGDNDRHRPLIIWMHGGGFEFGSKSAKGIRLWCSTFARRGYVCAGINYRLTNNFTIFHFDELLQASYYAVQDAKTAIDFFRQHASEYGIDPNKIILAGNSAGGMMALQAAYSDNSELSKLAKLDTDRTALNKPHDRAKVAAIISFWGGIYDLDWLKNAKVPIVSVLGSNDHIMPPTHSTAPLHGGEDIHQKADELGIPNILKVYDGYGHELQKHFNPFLQGGKNTEKRWLDAGQLAADFLYKTII